VGEAAARILACSRPGRGQQRPGHQIHVLLTGYPDVLLATIGLGLMCLASITDLAQRPGVPDEAIHHEAYAL
jgi:hypothetical protein